MAEQTPADIFMMFVYRGSPLRGESQSEIDLKSSELTKGFEPDWMFEVQSFTLKTGLESDDDTTKEQGKIKEEQAKQKAELQRTQDHVSDLHQSLADLQAEMDRLTTEMRKHVRDFHAGQSSGLRRSSKTGGGGAGGKGRPRVAGGASAASPQDFAKWRAGGPNGDVEYPVDMDPFTFTRSMDRATAELLSYCINRTPFDRAALIKRKAAGGKAAGQVFLRIDFTKCLLTNVAWSHDEPIKETYHFISRAVTIRYAPQLPDGSLGDPLPPAFWSMSKHHHPYRL